MATIFTTAINQVLGNEPIDLSQAPIPEIYKGYGSDEMVGLLCYENKTLNKMLYVGSSIAACLKEAFDSTGGGWFFGGGSYIDAVNIYGTTAIGIDNFYKLYKESGFCMNKMEFTEFTSLVPGPPPAIGTLYAFTLHIKCAGEFSLAFHGIGEFGISFNTWETSINKSYARELAADFLHFSSGGGIYVDPTFYIREMWLNEFQPFLQPQSVISVLSTNNSEFQIISEGQVCKQTDRLSKICLCENSILNALRIISLYAYRSFQLNGGVYIDAFSVDNTFFELLTAYPTMSISDIHAALEYWRNIVEVVNGDAIVDNTFSNDSTYSMCRCYNEYEFHVTRKIVYNEVPTDTQWEMVQISALPINKSLKPYILSLCGEYTAPNGTQKIAIIEGIHHGLSDDYGTEYNNLLGYNIAGYGFFIIPEFSIGYTGLRVINYEIDGCTIEHNTTVYEPNDFPKSNLRLVEQGIPSAEDYASSNTGGVSVYGQDLVIDYAECCQDTTSGFTPLMQWNYCDFDYTGVDIAKCSDCTFRYKFTTDLISMFVPVDLLNSENYNYFVDNRLNVVIYPFSDTLGFVCPSINEPYSAVLNQVGETQGFFFTKLSSDMPRGMYRFGIVKDAVFDTPLLLSEPFEYIAETSDVRGGCKQISDSLLVRFKSLRDSHGALYKTLLTQYSSVINRDFLWQQLRFPFILKNMQVLSDSVIQKESSGRSRLLSSNAVELWEVESDWCDYDKLLLFHKIFAHDVVEILDVTNNTWVNFILESKQDMKYPEKWKKAQFNIRIKKNNCISNNYVC